MKEDESIEYLVKKVDSIFDILKGENGNPGVCELVRNNRRDIDNLIETKKNKPIFIARYWQLMVSTGMFILAMITHFKKNN